MMKPQRCIVGGKKGDCFRACIATICELDAREIPNFIEQDCGKGEMFVVAREWLHQRGFGLFETYCSAGWPLEKVLRLYSEDNPGAPVIIAGVSQSHPDETHAVVALNGTIAHDPSGAGITAPYPCNCSDAECTAAWWFIYVITAMPCQMPALTRKEAA
jgi:hypothetical protein